MKLRCDWRAAANTKFKPDNVKSNAVVFRKKRLTCEVTKTSENGVERLRNWMVENQVKQYEMFTVYDVNKQSGEVFYKGLAFDFTNETDYVMFKLSCM